MTAVLDRVTEVQDQIIETIAKTKAPVTNAVSTVVGYVVDRVPEVPAVPFADQIPTPKELIDNQAKFASKLVTTNKSVALAAAKAAAPLTDQLLDRTASPVKAATAA
jgi:chemotaxis signal transduction protein